MSRKKIGLGLIALVAISVGIMLSLNQPISSFTTGTEDYTQDITELIFTFERVKVHATIYRGSNNGSIYLIIRAPFVKNNGTKQVDGIKWYMLLEGLYNVTVNVYVPYSNETYRGSKLIESVLLEEHHTDYYYWDITRFYTQEQIYLDEHSPNYGDILNSMPGFEVYGWVKVIG